MDILLKKLKSFLQHGGLLRSKYMNLIAVINVDSLKSFDRHKNSIESIRYAANNWKADYIEITECKYKEYNPQIIRNGGSWNGFATTKLWQLIWIMENFENYDNVLILDTDIFINSNSPNIFEELSDYDLAAVLDGNPGRLGDWIRNRSIDYYSSLNGCIEYFKTIENFDVEKYSNFYINTGVLLFNTRRMRTHIQLLKSIILDNPKIMEYLETHDSPIDQNLFSAWLSTSNVNLKLLDNTWNWTMPDISDEYSSFLGKMPVNIYHFCGTNLIKERLGSYDRWR